MNSADEATKKIKLMLCQMTKALETVGMVNPFNKVYYLVKPLDKLSLFMSLYTLSILQEMRFDTALSTLRKTEVKNQANKVVMDGPHLIVGILTVFKQFHYSYYRNYIQYLTHYYKSLVHVTQGRQMPQEGSLVLIFLEELMKFDGEAREVVGQSLGCFIFDSYNIWLYLNNH